MSGGGMHHEAGRLVQHQQVLVFVKNVEGNVLRLCLGRTRLGKMDRNLIACPWWVRGSFTRTGR